MNITRSFFVRAEPQVARTYLQDFSHATKWDPGTQRCERLDSGSIAVGSRWRNESRFLGRPVTLIYVLARLDENRVVFEGSNDSAGSRDDIQLAPAPEGGTRITYTATITLRSRLHVVLDPLLQLFMRPVADKTVDRMTTVLNGLR
ncbi:MULTISPECIES: SRPBCC family protein [Flexivirga]|uniref:Polyketide cyclase n=1 Tax=Flexivirga endophytica TaxID=1849103 RepID=A0A916SZ94_9MICO|nr:SRPBCC family protein [Flexivirga endophytica]GGB24408.1 polyketide cyclase [Flexivirga endophytica]GHB63102.1 polyketide cyclase [Flexivirga endophytica]